MRSGATAWVAPSPQTALEGELRDEGAGHKATGDEASQTPTAQAFVFDLWTPNCSASFAFEVRITNGGEGVAAWPRRPAFE